MFNEKVASLSLNCTCSRPRIQKSSALGLLINIHEVVKTRTGFKRGELFKSIFIVSSSRTINQDGIALSMYLLATNS
jgi:hypothetical protein